MSSHAVHAWRKISNAPAGVLIIVTKKLAHFFQETGRPVTNSTTPMPITPKDLAHFAAVSAKYGYWNGSPIENAQVGIDISF